MFGVDPLPTLKTIHWKHCSVNLENCNWPEICVRSCPIVMEIRNVERFCIQNADVARSQAMSESLEFWQHSWPWNIKTRRNENFSKIHLKRITIYHFSITNGKLCLQPFQGAVWDSMNQNHDFAQSTVTISIMPSHFSTPTHSFSARRKFACYENFFFCSKKLQCLFIKLLYHRNHIDFLVMNTQTVKRRNGK